MQDLTALNGFARNNSLDGRARGRRGEDLCIDPSVGKQRQDKLIGMLVAPVRKFRRAGAREANKILGHEALLRFHPALVKELHSVSRQSPDNIGF